MLAVHFIMTPPIPPAMPIEPPIVIAVFVFSLLEDDDSFLLTLISPLVILISLYSPVS